MPELCNLRSVFAGSKNRNQCVRGRAGISRGTSNHNVSPP